MKIICKTPQESLEKALLRFRPKEADFERFKLELASLKSKIDEAEREDNQEIHVQNFLRDAFYKNVAEINKKGTIDLALHLTTDKTSSVGVIIETKSPKSKEMIAVAKPNVKALHELVLYFMRERDEGNDDIRYLAATNINEWFVFSAQDFNRHFYDNREFRKDYESWRDKLKVSSNTPHFYNEIVKPFIDKLDATIECTHFDLRDYSKPGVRKLIALYKLLSPYHLLKSKFEDDSNTLDKKFYTELLHIIGLEEYKKKSKTLIRRKTTDNAGSLLEMGMTMLETKDVLSRIENVSQYGATTQERLESVALELCITWINRILFLKLLEAQLVNYHEGDTKYRFLTLETISDFDELFVLFHRVLAKTHDERPQAIKEKYSRVPYLNSSLFETSDLEGQTISIESLNDHEQLSIIGTSILKKLGEKAASLPTLEYLFRFLNAYDFASEGKEDIQSENRSLINASVLGKVFEKINGYKDGSIYTPGFITMYMCRQSIRLAIVQKFKDETDFEGTDFDELTNWVKSRNYLKDNIKLFNEIIDSLKICDPAVGSGHFLVSALNEILAIKSELGVFADSKFKTFGDYLITVANDELIITDRENNVFEYKIRGGIPLNAEMQRIQSTLFHEKQKLIENCLFGVDVNPNSVKICRLRLWIELLKNAYYKGSELETLPNIDINIKEGNSLISRFKLDEDLSQLPRIKQNVISEYRMAVVGYKRTRDREQKRQLLDSISKIKGEFREEFYKHHPKAKELLRNEQRLAKLNLPQLFDNLSDVEIEIKSRILKEQIAKLKKEIKDIKSNVLFRNAFEWRFEFPEVLDDDGVFKGFDVVIGNPPYGVSLKDRLRNAVVNCQGKVPDYEIYYFFTNLSVKLLSEHGIQSFIIPNTILFNVYARDYRKSLLDSLLVHELLDCTDFDIFVGSATVRNVITLLSRRDESTVIGYRPTAAVESFDELISRDRVYTDRTTLLSNNQNWALVFRLDETTLKLTSKIRAGKQALIDVFPTTSQGLIAYDSYQGQDEAIIRSRAYHSFEPKKHLKHWLWGEDVTRYAVSWNGREFIDYCDGIANPREPHFFYGPRVLVREITNPRIYAAFTNEELYNDPAIIVITDIGNDSYSMKVLLAILNSRLATFYHFKSSPKASKGAFPKILVDDINSFPLPVVSSSQQRVLEGLVGQILDLKKSNGNTSELEDRVDQLVYELYDLTPDEIAIVEG